MSKRRLYIDALPITTERTSGIGHMLAALVRGLSDRDDVQQEYEIILFGPRSGRDRAMSWGFKNVAYRALPFPKKVTTLLNLVHLLPPVDLFLGKGTYLFGNFVNYPVTRRSTSLTYVHDLCYLRHPEFLRPKVKQVLRRRLPGWMRRTNTIVTVSEDGRSDIAEFYPDLAAKTVAVLNGVDLDLFRPRTPDEVQSVKQKYQIKGNYLLYVGNIEPRKNLERLINAFRSLPDEVAKDYSLVLVGGDGWLNQAIYTAIDESNKAGRTVIWPKQYVEDDNVALLFAGATAGVLVSIHEGFGMPLIESMAAGTAVVSADIPSLREVVGEAGLYVDPLSEPSIAEGLKTIISDAAKRESLRQAGLVQVRQFTWANSVERLLQEIKKQSSK